MKKMNIKKIKKTWKGFFKEEDFFDYFSMYKAIQNSAQSIIIQMLDFLFIDSVYIAFLELLELNNNIDIMFNEKSPEVKKLCRERINYLISNKIENWYL